MTPTEFQPADIPISSFGPAGIEPCSEAFTAAIRVGDDGVSRGVPHVNNAEYVRWIDQIAELATDAAGFTRAWMLASDRMWFVARHEIDYRGEVFSGDELQVATWLDTWTRTTVRQHTAIVRPADQRLVCFAATRWAYVNLTSRRPARIPTEMQDAFPKRPAASGVNPTVEPGA